MSATTKAAEKDFIEFCTNFFELFQAPACGNFLREQFALLKSGVRDARIHDTAYNAYRAMGGVV